MKVILSLGLIEIRGLGTRGSWRAGKPGNFGMFLETGENENIRESSDIF